MVAVLRGLKFICNHQVQHVGERRSRTMVAIGAGGRGVSIIPDKVISRNLFMWSRVGGGGGVGQDRQNCLSSWRTFAKKLSLRELGLRGRK